MVENHIHKKFQLIKLLCKSHIDVVECVPVRLESSLPNAKQDDVAEKESTHSNDKQDKEAVDIMVVTEIDKLLQIQSKFIVNKKGLRQCTKLQDFGRAVIVVVPGR